MKESFQFLNLYFFGPLSFLFSLIAMWLSFKIKHKIVEAFDKKVFFEESINNIKSIDIVLNVLKELDDEEPVNMSAIVSTFINCVHRYSLLDEHTKEVASNILNIIGDKNTFNKNERIELINGLILIKTGIERKLVQ